MVKEETSSTYIDIYLGCVVDCVPVSAGQKTGYCQKQLDGPCVCVDFGITFLNIL